MANRLDKTLLKKAALAAWAQAVYRAADDACQRVGAFESKTRGAGGQFKMVTDRISQLILELKQIQQPPVSSLSNDCDADDDCPDGQICVNGTCDSPFPTS